MQQVESGDQNSSIKSINVLQAILVKDITFNKDDKEVTLKEGHILLVDIQNDIAFCGIDYFDICPSEYSLFS